MKVYLKHNGRYWTGRIGAFRDGSNIFFVTHESIHKAKDLATEQNALDSLEWWCNQCGADPKEWTLEIHEDEKPKHYPSTCSDIPMIDLSSDYSDGTYNTIYDGLYQKYFSEMMNYGRQKAIDRFRREVTDKLSDRITISSPKTFSMQRTINEICKDIERHKDDYQSLLQLKEEVEQGNLNKIEYNYALESIGEKIEAINHNSRKKQIKSRFEED